MGKRISQLVQLLASQLAAGDLIPIVDTSAGVTKYVTVKDLTGLPDFGWTATGESWAYASASTITVPTDATTKYSVGMAIRFVQSATTKYGVITGVTATVLTVAMVGSTLTNSAITSPVYTSAFAPIGFQPTTLQMSNPVKSRVYRNAAFTLTANAYTLIPFDTKNFDTNSNMDISINKGRFTAPVAGFYDVNASINCGTGQYIIPAIYKNGVLITNGSDLTSSAGSMGAGVADLVQLAAGDYLEIYVNSGTGSLGMGTGSPNSFFSVALRSIT